MNYLRLQYWVRAILFTVCALIGAAAPSAAAALKWPSGPYKYVVVDQDLKGVLIEFGHNIGVPVQISDQVSGRLHGVLPAGSAQKFLAQLCENYGLVWYFDGAVLHVNAKSEVKTELIDIGQLPPSQLKELPRKLQRLGVADQRFPIRIVADTGVISVAGPPPYVTLVRQTIAAIEKSATPTAHEDPHGDDARVRVFRGSSMVLPIARASIAA